MSNALNGSWVQKTDFGTNSNACSIDDAPLPRMTPNFTFLFFLFLVQGVFVMVESLLFVDDARAAKVPGILRVSWVFLGDFSCVPWNV